MGFKIEYGDITNFKGDAIINSLGTDIEVYGKLCDAIVKANDNPALPLFLKSINGKANVLDCYITESLHLSVTHIIHIVAPYKNYIECAISTL